MDKINSVVLDGSNEDALKRLKEMIEQLKAEEKEKEK